MVEGIFAFYDEECRDLFDFKIFVDVDSDVRLLRRVIRDTTTRGRKLETILHSYNRFVKNAYDDFIKPTIAYSDITVHGGHENKKALDLILGLMQSQLQTHYED